MSRSINNMLAIFGESAASGPAFARAYHFIFKRLPRFIGYFTYEHLVTHQSFFCIRALENDPLTIKTEIGFGVIAPECELLHILKMRFPGIYDRILAGSGLGFGS